MNHYTRFVVFALAIALVAMRSSTVMAVIVLDQEHIANPLGGASTYTFDPSGGSTFGRSQTFTVGTPGILHSVEVESTQFNPASPPSQVRILATSGGIPIGGFGGSTVLASSSIVSSLGNWHRFDVSSAGLVVNIGDVLAIEPIDIDSGFWLSDLMDLFPSGSDFVYNTGVGLNVWTAAPLDNSFRTFVQTEVQAVPEPEGIAIWSAVVVVVLGFVIQKRFPSGRKPREKLPNKPSHFIGVRTH